MPHACRTRLPNTSILDGYVRQRPTRAPSSSRLQYRIPKSTAIDYPDPRAVVVVEAQPFDFVARGPHHDQKRMMPLPITCSREAACVHHRERLSSSLP